MNRALIPALALFALLPLASVAAPGDDQKPAVQKPDTKRDPAAKDAMPCCSHKEGKGAASGMPHDMHEGGDDHGGMSMEGHGAMMHEGMHGDAGTPGGHEHGM